MGPVVVLLFYINTNCDVGGPFAPQGIKGSPYLCNFQSHCLPCVLTSFCHVLHVSQETMRNSVNCEKAPLDNICFLLLPFYFSPWIRSSSFSPECLTTLVEKQIHSISGSLVHFCQWFVFFLQDIAGFTLGNPAWVHWDWTLKWK